MLELLKNILQEILTGITKEEKDEIKKIIEEEEKK